RQEDDGRRVDRHRGRYAVEWDAGKELFHVGDRVDGDADAADLSLREGMVGVVTHLRRQVEGDTEPANPLAQQVMVAPVRLGRGAEPGILAHGPQAAAVHGWLYAAREW